MGKKWLYFFSKLFKNLRLWHKGTLLSLESKLSKTTFSFTYIWVSKGQLLLFAELNGGDSYLTRFGGVTESSWALDVLLWWNQAEMLGLWWRKPWFTVNQLFVRACIKPHTYWSHSRYSMKSLFPWFPAQSPDKTLSSFGKGYDVVGISRSGFGFLVNCFRCWYISKLINLDVSMELSVPDLIP